MSQKNKNISNFTKIANASIKLLPLFFILMVYFHPLNEKMICDKDFVCNIERLYLFNIKTKKAIKINKDTNLYFKVQKYVNHIFVSKYHSRPRLLNGYVIYPIINESKHNFHQVFTSNYGIYGIDEASIIADEEKAKFESYKNKCSDGYSLETGKITSEGNIFLIIFTFIMIIWCYYLYQKRPDEYKKFFYIIMFGLILRQFLIIISKHFYL